MQIILCPCCGGQVVFRSAASVMTVCEYCQSTLLKDAESVKDIGKVATLLEDYSPLQITSSGTFQGRHFDLLGRIQLRYEAGFWNEWHLLFDDGASGWLSDASGQYVLTQAQNGAAPQQSPQSQQSPQASQISAPAFDALRPGTRYGYQGATFFASDIRIARCLSWQGELPFRVDRGWEAKVADFRCDHRFLTLDYSDSSTPETFLGQAVTLEQLQCQLLRDNDAISSSAGRFRGQTVALDCPNCGGSIKYLAGMAFHIVCPSCHSQIDCSTDKALVLQKAEEVAQVATTLALGDRANIGGSKYEAIGFLQCHAGDEEESSTWVEYLLFGDKQDFLWLVESSEGWEKIAVLNEWPAQTDGDAVRVQTQSYQRTESYDATVIYAAGAFNWRAAVGDVTRITDYQQGNRKISAEATDQEIVWNASQKVAASQIGQWFGKQLADTAEKSDSEADGSLLSFKPAIVFSALLVILNLPISLGSGAHGIKLMFWALLILWAPPVIIRYFLKKA